MFTGKNYRNINEIILTPSLCCLFLPALMFLKDQSAPDIWIYWSCFRENYFQWLSSFILFAYVITTLVLNILEKALKNVYPVLESYLFSVIYPKTSNSILPLSNSEKSEYFEMLSRNSLSSRFRTLSSGLSKCKRSSLL